MPFYSQVDDTNALLVLRLEDDIRSLDVAVRHSERMHMSEGRAHLRERGESCEGKVGRGA